MLHDPTFRNSIEARLKALRPDAPRKWGRMNPDQMLWHVNQFLTWAIGEESAERQKNPIPAPLLRFFVLYMPWPTSAPTHKNALAKGDYDFDTERERCLALIGRFASRPLDGPWPEDPAFGSVTGKFTSKLQAKHLDYHFRQFSG
jgi:hypothetical protein